MTVAVETTQHEVSMNLIWCDFDPIFALDNAIKKFGGSNSKTVVFDGIEWRCTLYYQESGIMHPGEELPDGTPYHLETIREYRIDCKAIDGLQERKVNFHIAPRWDGMRAEESGEEIPTPPQLDAGINVRANGSNYEAEMYVHLLKNVAAMLDAGGRYYEEETLHPYSNVQDLARYVRVNESESGPVHGRSGPIAQMGHLLENDRSGYRSVEQKDTDRRGNDLPGYRHKTILGSDRVREMTPRYEAPKEVKHYYARESSSMDPNKHPLAHPKVEVAYQASKWDETIRYSDLDELNEELERTLYAVLKEAGLSLYDHDTGEPGNGALYVSDKYFDADSPHSVQNIPTLGLDSIQREQENVVIKNIKDGLSPVQWESLETLVADGGEVSPEQIAEENERHVGSVRRALQQIDQLVETEYGSVALKSNHVSELVHDAVRDAEEAVKAAVETGGKALSYAEEQMEEAETVLQEYAASRQMDVTRDEDIRVRIRGNLDDLADLKERVRNLARHWEEAGRDLGELKAAKVVYQMDRYQVHHEGLHSLIRRGGQ